MSALYAGFLCTLLLTGTVAGLFGCMSAARCHRRAAFALCLAMAALNFIPLTAVLAHLPTCGVLSPVPWTAAALLLTALGLAVTALLVKQNRHRLSPVSIKESCDHLPCALCFAWENGRPCPEKPQNGRIEPPYHRGSAPQRQTFGKPLRISPSSPWKTARPGASNGGR